MPKLDDATKQALLALRRQIGDEKARRWVDEKTRSYSKGKRQSLFENANRGGIILSAVGFIVGLGAALLATGARGTMLFFGLMPVLPLLGSVVAVVLTILPRWDVFRTMRLRPYAATILETALADAQASEEDKGQAQFLHDTEAGLERMVLVTLERRALLIGGLLFILGLVMIAGLVLTLAITAL